MTTKPTIVFTFPNCMGGVSSFNYNIINYSSLIKNFYSKVVLLKAKEDKRLPFLDKFIADEVIFFEYSSKENQYYVQQRLNVILGNEEGAIVTDDSLTLATANRFNNPKTVFHLLHDFFYVKQNIVFGNRIDVAIAHSSFFSDAVFASNPLSFGGRSYYIPYGVKQYASSLNKQATTKLNLVFVGRLDDGKGVLYLFEIEKILQQHNIEANWTIIGKGPLQTELELQWKDKNNVQFFRPDSTDEVFKILEKQDVFVFPTSFEGTPVSILECLATGVVTIVNDLPGGIRDIVTNNIGFRCKLNNIEEFANNIMLLNSNRTLLNQMQQNCFQLFQQSYNISQNADKYFELFLQYDTLKRKIKNTPPIIMSRLDKPYIPNFITKALRSLR